MGTLYSPVDVKNALFLAEEKSLARFGGRGVHSSTFLSAFFFRLFFQTFFQTLFQTFFSDFFFRLFFRPGSRLLFHLVFFRFLSSVCVVFYSDVCFRPWIHPVQLDEVIVFFRRLKIPIVQGGRVKGKFFIIFPAKLLNLFSDK